MTVDNWVKITQKLELQLQNQNQSVKAATNVIDKWNTLMQSVFTLILLLDWFIFI